MVLACPKVGTRWIRSTFSSHCQLSSYQHRWLTSGTPIIYSSEMFWKCWESNPEQQGPQASMLTNVLCCTLCSIFFAKQRLISLGYCAPLTFTKLFSGWAAELEVVALLSELQKSWAQNTNLHFCLQPSVKDQGITWVVVVLLVLVLHLLVHFLIKRNWREKNSPLPGFKPGTSRSTVWHSTNWAKETLLDKCLKIIYLFQKSRCRPWTSIGRHLLALTLQ